MNSVSYAITTHNEGKSIGSLLSTLTHYKRKCDEIVILDDHSTDSVTKNILSRQSNVYTRKFNKNFAEHKNHLSSLCRCDYIFQLDGDELPSRSLCSFIQTITEHGTDVDLFWIPRDNQLYDINMDYIKKLKWVVDTQNRINYPDYQGRFFKNKPHIKWIRPVHEIISGHNSQVILPKNSNIDILHHRHMDHQIRSNTFYDENF